ncbi:DUF5689 domain-containing protein [Flavobacterium crassostreae]|uniref:DUF5689 domain-containing protein n=1 Tax=Flavobacterium crassostreae TaxID=1763534 RepID=A0A1B9E5L0_9FLAO|nr:DUF5689 domain-containing protein [Flavobacterium crassostreae]OCB77250.1 hypothetical protein LPBF_04420 [Flavobacterium crassostreae]
MTTSHWYSYSSLLLLGILFWSCEQQNTSIPSLECNQAPVEATKTVAEIRQSATAIVSAYPYKDIIEVYVVSSDEYGTFFKTISFQTLATATTASIGFSVPVDVSNTYVDYPLGTKVSIQLQDQFTDIKYGGLRIGGLYVSSFNTGGVGRLSATTYKKVLLASCTNLTEDQLVTPMTIAQSQNEDKLNTLIELDNVQFKEDAIGRSYYEEANDIGGATNWSLLDTEGNQIIFRTSSYARFASNLVPTGSGTVRGVLTKYGDDFQLVARSEADIKIKNERNIPFFIENFQSVTDKANLSLPGWTNIVEAGKLSWRSGVIAGNGYAEFAISGTKVASNIAWLISPKIDMDLHKNETLTFRTAQEKLDVDSPLNSLEVYVATDFDGLNVSQANWVLLDPNLPKQASPWGQFIGSGKIDLSDYQGKINIAFKYTGSGKNTALDGSFLLDDVQIFSN